MDRRRLFLLLALLGTAAPTLAAEAVYRCEDALGRRVFSDQPCRSFGALPLPSEGDPDPLPPSAEELAAMAAAAQAKAEAEAELIPPAAASGCPGSDPQQLAEALSSALERSDLNATAALFHWPAAGRGTARWVFATAERLARQQPLQITLRQPPLDDSWLWAGQPPPDPSLTPLPLIEVLDGENPERRLQQFRLIRNAGCVWLLPH